MRGFVLARVRAHRWLLAAALLTVLLTTSVLAALSAFAATIGDTGLRRSLQHQSAPRTVIDVQSDVTGESAESADKSVRAATRRAFGGLPTTVEASTHSGSYALPRALRPADAAKGGEPDLTLFASLDRDRVRMTEGTWPSAPPAPSRTGKGTAKGEDGRPTLPAAMPQAAAERLGLRTGDQVDLTSRLSGPPPVRAEITGLYAPKDRADPYWRLDPLGGDAVRTLAFTTYGPMAVGEDAFTGSGAPLEPAERRWQGHADFSSVSTTRIGELRDGVRGAVAGLGKSQEAGSPVATSELPALLDRLERTLLVGRSTLLIAALQLAVLAGLALLLVAQLLAAERSEETALLRARGGSRARIAALSAAEALLLVLPGALLAPLIAGPAVSELMRHGALARAGVEPAVRLPAAAWWVAAATALACALTVVAPILRGQSDRAVSTRRRKATALLRGGSDLALVAVAAVAYWQLERRAAGSGVLSGGDGDDGTALGIDPVLVTAPALALLAGTVVTLRLLPLLARLGERRAARTRGLAGALAGWQFSRRPVRGAGPALLLVLAVAMGVFAVGQGASWDRSQGDQADFRTGADMSVTSAGTPAFGQGGLYDAIDGIGRVAPVARDEFPLEGDRTAQVVATDTRAASGLLRVRDDLTGGRPAEELMRPLAGPGPGSGTDSGTGSGSGSGTDSGPGPGSRSGEQSEPQRGIVLPEHTRELRLSLRLETLGGERRSRTDDDIAVTLEDRFGVPYEFMVDELPADGRTHTPTVPLAAATGGTGGAPAGPLRLTRLSVSHLAPTENEERRLTLTALDATDGDGSVHRVPAPSGLRWGSELEADDSQGFLGSGRHARPKLRAAGPGPGGSPLTVRYTTGSAPDSEPWDVDPVPVDIQLLPGTGQPPESAGQAPLTAVATDTFLTSSGAKVGDSVKTQISGTEVTVRITGSLRALPTTTATGGKTDGGAVLLDLAALDRTLLAQGAKPLEPQSWWVNARPGQTARVAGELRAHPSFESVLVRDELAAQLRGDPLSAGPRTALTAIAVAAAVLAAVGFAVSAAGAVRERAAEFAVLRALGAPRRRLAQVLATEQSTLVLVSLAIGLALGILLTRLVVPLIVLTGEATRPVPELLVQLPPGRLTLLLGVVLVAPLLVITGTALRGADPVVALRTERGN